MRYNQNERVLYSQFICLYCCLFVIFKKFKSVVLTMYLLSAKAVACMRYTEDERALYSLSICSRWYMRTWCMRYTENESVVLTKYLITRVSIWDIQKWKSVLLTMNLFMLVSIWDIMKKKEFCNQNLSVHAAVWLWYIEKERVLYSQCTCLWCCLYEI